MARFLIPEFRKVFGRSLMPLATDCLKTSQLLIDAGHESVKLRREFEQKICTPKEFEESLEVQIEVAKEKISSCYVRVIETDVASDNYVSPLLDKLRQQRDHSGFDRQWLVDGASETWRYEINPAKRRTGQMFHSSQFQAEIDQYRELEKATSELEKQRFLVDPRIGNMAISEPYNANVHAKFKEISDNEVSLIGFLPSEKLSNPTNLLQYTRPVSDVLQLRLSLVMSSSMFQARLFLAENDLGRKFDGNWHEWYSSKSAHEIRIWDIIPWFSYKSCFDVSALLVSFYAHMSALKLGISTVINAASAVGNSIDTE